MDIDIVAIVAFLGICLCIVMAGVQLWFYAYGARWFYLNTKDEPKEEK